MASLRQRNTQTGDQESPHNTGMSPRLTKIDGKNEGLGSSEGDSQEALTVGRRNLIQKATTQTLASTAHLANLLPTGTVLAFQILGPIVSNNGRCDSVSRAMTVILLVGCAFSCFITSFTDSFRGGDGKIYYGLATPKGLWALDYGGSEIPDGAKYRLRAVDFVHAFLSALVFGAIALYDQNVVRCFYPAPENETREVLDVLPIAIGFSCSLLFLVFPTTRRGIGFPVSNS